MQRKNPIFLPGGGMKCPRPSCRFEQESLFDSLAMSRESECAGYLLPVFKCPQCKHLFSALPAEFHEVLRAAGLVE